MKTSNAYKTISEAAKALNITSSTIRFWETEFKQIKPYIIKSRRYYSPENIEILGIIKELLYDKGYTIAGAIRYFETSQNQSSTLVKMTQLLAKIKLARKELS